MKLRKGDKVLVIKGKDRGKQGTVLAVNSLRHQVKLEGLNVYKRHLRKAARPGVPGGITDKTLPVSVSKVMLLCANCHQPTRVGYQLVNNKKERVCKKCQAIIAYVKG